MIVASVGTHMASHSHSLSLLAYTAWASYHQNSPHSGVIFLRTNFCTNPLPRSTVRKHITQPSKRLLKCHLLRQKQTCILVSYQGCLIRSREKGMAIGMSILCDNLLPIPVNQAHQLGLVICRKSWYNHGHPQQTFHIRSLTDIPLNLAFFRLY